jgi:hypothetical protein
MAPGENVFEQAKIMKIAQIDPLLVEVYLPIAVFPVIKEGMNAEVRPSQPAGTCILRRYRSSIRCSTLPAIPSASASWCPIRLTTCPPA